MSELLGLRALRRYAMNATRMRWLSVGCYASEIAGGSVGLVAYGMMGMV